MQLALLLVAAVHCVIAQPPPPNDPVALEIGFRKLRRSKVLATIKGSTTPEQQRAALSQLANRVLLLQEADRSGLVRDLPNSPVERASAFLKNVVSARVICSKINERELALMYRAMRPRFVHDHLYRLAELRLTCWQPTIGCARSLSDWAMQHWGPVLVSLDTKDELHMMWEHANAPPGVIQYREYTVHIDDAGNSAAPRQLTDAIQKLEPGDTAMLISRTGVRAPMLVEYEPPSNRTLDDPDVRRQVHEELCPRIVKKNREAYLDNLRRSAYVKIYREAWPPSIVLPAKPSE